MLGPVYIAELAPAKWRGRLVGSFQVNVVFGILFAYISNWWIAQLGLGLEEWRWQLGIAVIPASIFCVLLYTIPQSSRFLITQNSLEDALSVLRMMGSDDPDRELSEIRASLHSRHLQKIRAALPAVVAATYFSRDLNRAVNQFSGINAVLYYANDIFAAAGLSRLSTFSQSIYIGLANLVGTAIGMLLIDKIGRKLLLLIGAAGTFVCLLATAMIFSSGKDQGRVVWLLVTFICLFALSQGAVIWVYIWSFFRHGCVQGPKPLEAARTG